MKLETENDFKLISCLRLHLDGDKTPIAVPYGQNVKASKDHLYFHGRGMLGIYLERNTERSFTYAVKAYKALLKGKIVLEQLGDLDGILVFRPETVEDIPSTFKKSSGRCLDEGDLSSAEPPDGHPDDGGLGNP